MFDLFGQDLYTAKFNDEFVGVIASKSVDYLALLIYNYIDPQAAMNYISHNIVYLNSVEQKAILSIVKSDRMKKIIDGQLSLATLRLSIKTKNMLSRAIELNSLVNKFSTTSRKLKVSLKGAKDTHLLSKYVMDSNCSRNCEFKPSFEKELDFNQSDVETIELSPYSVQLLVFKKKTAPAEVKLEDQLAETKSAEIKPEIKIEDIISAEVKPEDKPLEIKPIENKLEEKTALKESGNAETK